MADANITTEQAQAELVRISGACNRLFAAMSVLHGLEAYADENEDGSGICTSLSDMSAIARGIINDVTKAITP